MQWALVRNGRLVATGCRSPGRAGVDNGGCDAGMRECRGGVPGEGLARRL